MLYNQQEEHSTHSHKGSGALESPPQKSSTKVTHKKKAENHPKTVIYDHYDQSYQFTSDPDHTPK